MIHVDESDPVGDNKLSFPPRDVTIKRGVDAKEFYDLHTEVGRGKFGTVYKCKEKSTGLQLAAKYVPIPKRDDKRNVEREVEIMNSLQHPLIIQLYDAYEYQKMMCVVLELIEGGELFDRVIDDDFILTEKSCIVFIRQVCQAMEFIHRNNILHLDLKPENILCLTREGNRVKLIDFGLARKYDPEKKLQILFGTPEFVAPEVVNFDRISFGTDMWSVGVICYVLLSGLSPFMGETDIATMANVTIAKYDFDDEVFSKISKESLDFISKLLVKDISVRMTATECLDHTWLKRTSKPQLAPKPAAVPPPKYRSTTSPQEIISKDVPIDLNNELDLTKENLKNFIERWEEHPNSPYVIETAKNQTNPILINNRSTTSSRVCSPSPCGSLSSTPELPDHLVDQNHNHHVEFRSKKDVFANMDLEPSKNFKEYLQTFERRHSDSNCLLNRSSSCEKINLAEEIKKLSERLLMLSSINTELNDYNHKVQDGGSSNATMINGNAIDDKKLSTLIAGGTTKTKKSKISDHFNRSVSVSEISNKKSVDTFKFTTKISQNNSVTTKKTISTTSTSGINGSSSISSSSSSSSRSTKKNSSKNVVSALSERLKEIDETPSLLNKLNSENKSTSIKTSKKTKPVSSKISSSTVEETAATTTGINASISKEIISSSTTTATTTITENNNGIDSISTINGGSAPWPVTKKRTKFRVTQLSRDVPIDSPDTHRTVFLDETANTTKDRLLHLLEKYNENDTRSHNINQLRHQSFSVDFGLSDNLEYRSMNSLNAFFQRHALNGTNVKQIQQKIESKNK